MRVVTLFRVVTGAITAYTSGALQPASVDAQGNLRVAFTDTAGSAAGGLSSGTQNPIIAGSPLCWTISNLPAVNTMATATRAAGGAGVRHVATGLCIGLNLFAALAAPLTVVIRDGATGVGTIIFETRLTGATPPIVGPLSILGSPNTAMTVEFTAAPGATNFENVWMQGYSIALA